LDRHVSIFGEFVGFQLCLFLFRRFFLGLFVFAVLVYMQFRTWRNFDWATFWAQGEKLYRPPHIFHILLLSVLQSLDFFSRFVFPA